jgi:hypothetical protein
VYGVVGVGRVVVREVGRREGWIGSRAVGEKYGCEIRKSDRSSRLIREEKALATILLRYPIGDTRGNRVWCGHRAKTVENRREGGRHGARRNA